MRNSTPRRGFYSLESMNTVVSQDFEDWPEWPLRDTRYMSYGSTATEDSEASLLSISRFQPPPSPTTSISPTVSDKGKASPPVDVVRVNLSPAVTMYVSYSSYSSYNPGYIRTTLMLGYKEGDLLTKPSGAVADPLSERLVCFACNIRISILSKNSTERSNI